MADHVQAVEDVRRYKEDYEYVKSLAPQSFSSALFESGRTSNLMRAGMNMLSPVLGPAWNWLKDKLNYLSPSQDMGAEWFDKNDIALENIRGFVDANDESRAKML